MINLLSGVKTREFISHFLIISVVFVACFLFGPTRLYADPPGPYYLTVTPSIQPVAASSGTTSFEVKASDQNNWTSQVTSGGDWLTISKPDNFKIICSYKANSSTAGRTGTIRVTPSEATVAPQDVTVSQEGQTSPPVLSVSPGNKEVGKDAGSTTFDVANTGTGSLNWTAQVVDGGWLSIAGGASGNNNGKITCSFGANTGTWQRRGVIRVTAPGALGSPVDVTVTQAPTPLQPVLFVTPPNQAVAKDAGTTTFNVSNTGTGSMTWGASVISGSWLTITSGTSGTDYGTINCNFTANISTSTRTATVRVTAVSATGSPVDVTVTQAPTPPQPILSVSPTNQAVAKDAGTTAFNVSNTGTGAMLWTAAVTSGGTWLSITSGDSGSDSGTINCSYSTNTTTSARTGTIRITAAGAWYSPVDVTVTQALTPPQPILSVSPTSRDVAKDAGTTTFSVSNTGTGAMTWGASVISGSWLTITSGASGTDSGTINDLPDSQISCSFTANTSTSPRTATIRVTAAGAWGSPMDVTVKQAPTPPQPVLSVTPSNQPVAKDAGTTAFNVSNTGTGSMLWTAAVTSGGTWLSITSGASGSNSGTINCSYSTNTTTSARTGTIRVTAADATGSPVDVTVTQALTPQPILSVSPTSRDVAKDAGTTTFSVSNTGIGAMTWGASVISGSWLTITSGASGTDSGTINCNFTANTSTSTRTATIRVTATGATGSPMDVMVTQAGGWASHVPDTGQSKCYNTTVEIPCPSSGQPFYGQDAQYTINPMSYTKLDGSGNTLPDSATSWVMVKDNVIGLVWEMKTSKDGVKNYNDPHDADNDYTWYDSNPATNGGNAGTQSAGKDTESFLKALNDSSYGGYSDWRMPTIKELAYIVNYSVPYPGPMIDTGYFPNTAASWYWSSTTYVGNTDSAWLVNFINGIRQLQR